MKTLNPALHGRKYRIFISAIILAGLLLPAVPAQAFWGQGKLRAAWHRTTKAAKWVGKKIENAQNQERAHQRGR